MISEYYFQKLLDTYC